MRFISAFSCIACLLAGTAFAGESPSPAGAKAYFINLHDSQTIKSPFTVLFGLKKMGIAPAGVDNETYEHIGHHHLLIDTPLTHEIIENGIPFDKKHLHFGKGQTETELDLPKGTYRLRLVFGDPYHIPHNPVVASDEITITVK